MDLRTDAESRLQDQNLSRAARLQCRWQEVSERERRAQLQNRKLLQDFQRAQDTLCDLVARTEAMNTIRVEYERYLEESFPQWQQKLKNKRLTEQRKRIEQHLKACIQQREEDQRTVHVRMPRSSLTRKGNKQNTQGIIQNDVQPFYVPFNWLTQPQPSEDEPLQSHISKETKTFQNINHALNSYLLLPGDPLQGLQEPPSSDNLRQHPKAWAGGAQCDPAGAPWTALPVVNPLAGRIMGMSEDDAHPQGMWCSEEAEGEKWRINTSPQTEKHQTRKQRRKMKGSDHSSNSKLVHLSNLHGDSSESSALSCEAVASFAFGMQKRRRERRGDKQTEQPTEEGSSSTASSHSDMNNKKDTSKHTPSVRKTFKNQKVPIAKVRSKFGVEPPKHLEEESEPEAFRIQETVTCNSTAVEKKGYNKKVRENNRKEEKKRVHEGVEGSLSDDGKSKGGEEGEKPDLADKEQNEEDGSEGSYGKRKSRCCSDEEEADGGKEDEAWRRNVSDGGSLSEKLKVEDGGEEEEDRLEEEEEDRGEEDLDEGEQELEDGVENQQEHGEKEEEEKGQGDEESKESSVEVRASRRRMEDDDESHNKENDREAASSVSVRNTHDSLKELYKDDETEDEELYDQEVEDDIEDEDDDVVVEKEYPWSCDPAYDHTKYQEGDDDDDVEGLLAPRNNVQQHQPDEAEKTVKTKDFHRDSEDEGSRRDTSSAPVKEEPVDSDDEFDHFYD